MKAKTDASFVKEILDFVDAAWSALSIVCIILPIESVKDFDISITLQVENRERFRSSKSEIRIVSYINDLPDLNRAGELAQVIVPQVVASQNKGIQSFGKVCK